MGSGGHGVPPLGNPDGEHHLLHFKPMKSKHALPVELDHCNIMVGYFPQ